MQAIGYILDHTVFDPVRFVMWLIVNALGLIAWVLKISFVMLCIALVVAAFQLVFVQVMTVEQAMIAGVLGACFVIYSCFDWLMRQCRYEYYYNPYGK